MYWTEEYHPKSLKKIVGNIEIIKKLKQMVDTKLQNLIITGSSGVGKSSSIYSIIKEMNAEHIELNASDERNISTIRTTIKTFAMKKSFSPKIIVLEEIDNMPKASQHGIASLMEKSNAHFILTCNDYDKIIENLTSRCMILKFKTIEQEDIKNHLIKISKDKNIKYNIEVINVIAKRSEGDLRKAINTLQLMFFYSKEQTLENLEICSTEPSSVLIQNIITSCLNKNLEKAILDLNIILHDGYDCSDIISFLFKECCEMIMDDYLKINILKKIGETHVTMVNESSKIQLYALLVELNNI